MWSPQQTQFHPANGPPSNVEKPSTSTSPKDSSNNKNPENLKSPIKKPIPQKPETGGWNSQPRQTEIPIKTQPTKVPVNQHQPHPRLQTAIWDAFDSPRVLTPSSHLDISPPTLISVNGTDFNCTVLYEPVNFTDLSRLNIELCGNHTYDDKSLDLSTPLCVDTSVYAVPAIQLPEPQVYQPLPIGGFLDDWQIDQYTDPHLLSTGPLLTTDQEPLSPNGELIAAELDKLLASDHPGPYPDSDASEEEDYKIQEEATRQEIEAPQEMPQVISCEMADETSEETHNEVPEDTGTPKEPSQENSQSVSTGTQENQGEMQRGHGGADNTAEAPPPAEYNNPIFYRTPSVDESFPESPTYPTAGSPQTYSSGERSGAQRGRGGRERRSYNNWNRGGDSYVRPHGPDPRKQRFPPAHVAGIPFQPAAYSDSYNWRSPGPVHNMRGGRGRGSFSRTPNAFESWRSPARGEERRISPGRDSLPRGNRGSRGGHMPKPFESRNAQGRDDRRREFSRSPRGGRSGGSYRGYSPNTTEFRNTEPKEESSSPHTENSCREKSDSRGSRSNTFELGGQPPKDEAKKISSGFRAPRTGPSGRIQPSSTSAAKSQSSKSKDDGDDRPRNAPGFEETNLGVRTINRVLDRLWVPYHQDEEGASGGLPREEQGRDWEADARGNNMKDVLDEIWEHQKHSAYNPPLHGPLSRRSSSSNRGGHRTLADSRRRQPEDGRNSYGRGGRNYGGSSDGRGGSISASNMFEFWRQNPSGLNSDGKSFWDDRYGSKQQEAPKPTPELPPEPNQQQRLTEQLMKAGVDCMVCIQLVRRQDRIWSCRSCYNIFHLGCIQSWAHNKEEGWSCPACQTTNYSKPRYNKCFCGKVTNPTDETWKTPHTCGQVCNRTLSPQVDECQHRCTELCHPGPCMECPRTLRSWCCCEATSRLIRCKQPRVPFTCSNECGSLLSCKIHNCNSLCHAGECPPCDKKETQTCFCGKATREAGCCQGKIQFSCGASCDHELPCGYHDCEEPCHEGRCQPCQLRPDLVTCCPCGKTPLTELLEKPREVCTDPVPLCNKSCDKQLPCGRAGSEHLCKKRCHKGECPVCPEQTLIHCRCKKKSKSVPCSQMNSIYLCASKCGKFMNCGVHKCHDLCCVKDIHICELTCKKRLDCGQHRCTSLCHPGKCQSCPNTSFEELHCRCGATILYPPIKCGTPPPKCSKPCNRQHSCAHKPQHLCHNDENCPPCTAFVDKMCYGGHELRKNLLCMNEGVSCGRQCKTPLPCGRHLCPRVCHQGVCFQEGVTCTLPCETRREVCQHPCSAPCHKGKCPDIPCQEVIKVTCKCGHRSLSKVCQDNLVEFNRLQTGCLFNSIVQMQEGHSVELMTSKPKSKLWSESLKCLECSGECASLERARRMAEALQITSSESSFRTSNPYSDQMKQLAKRDPDFANRVHNDLEALVKLARESPHKCKSHFFEKMNKEKRAFVHEYCGHFGCTSVSTDQEPHRSVTATAFKGQCILPTFSVVEVCQRENGQRKVPLPRSLLSSTRK